MQQRVHKIRTAQETARQTRFPHEFGTRRSCSAFVKSSSSASTSGKTPTNRTLAKAASPNGSIYGVTIGEDSDDPCYMEIKYRDVATWEAQPSLKFSECAGHKIGDQLTPLLPSGAFVTGVQICMNSARNK
ncbi:hypothetical protein SAMN05216403_10210 [Nitrosospira multiformis ATCC 25196]|uniref:Uncharacterized protein n=1 Tax=Nitrosospira multiformis (strain ATCC 25196 / NCIMB 11849 / C 71) TaxID=323848 RepID=A0A1H5S5M4_NITMU|nr:hypothetical protein SAMN05216411_10425 [Nitrosospira multiformis]SEF45916.1 hypothetical protein SAMN05216403_10210 [Nitrosospira multiformis ATCC 25196]